MIEEIILKKLEKEGLITHNELIQALKLLKKQEKKVC